MDGTTAPCQHGPYSQSSVAPDPYQGNGGTPPPAGKNYADRHNPFLYFPDIIGDTNRCQRHVVPFTNLADDIANKKVPQFVFITPDTCHDGHDNPCSGGAPGGLVSLDAWLSKHGPALVKYVYSHNSLLLITFDEGSNTDASGCCTGGPGGSAGVGGRVGLVALGPHVKGGQTVSTKYDHVSMLRAIEDLFGISDHLGNASTASPMSDIFAP
jgi:phospholipase C